MRGATLFLALAGASIAIVLRAAPQDAPQFRTRLDLVQLDVSVVDSKHQPVRGLTADDFTVLENGKRQAIQAFVPIDLPEEPPRTPGWMRDVAPDVVANTNVDEDRLIVLVLDDYSEDMDKDLFGQKKIKEIAHGIIDRLGPRDLAAVVYTVASKNNQEFTHDHARLIEAVDKYNRLAAIPEMAAPFVLPRVVEVLGSVPQRRKILIWLSPGVLPPGSAGVIELAQHYNVNIFPIDPTGIRPATAQPPAPNVAVDPTAPPTFADNIARMSDIEHLSALRTNMFFLAAGTGGQMFQFNEFTKSINQVLTETGSFYLLGYVSTNTTPDDKWRDVEVKVNRKGVTVHARTKNSPKPFATPASASAAPSPALEALAGLVPVRDVPISLSVVPFMSEASAGPTTAAAVMVAIGLPAPVEGADDFDVVLKAFTFDGTLKGTRTFPAHVTATSTKAADRQVQVIQRVDLPPGRYQMRVGVTSAQRRASGSVYADFDVPDFGRDLVSMSGVALSNVLERGIIAPDMPGRLPIVLPMTTRAFAANALAAGLIEFYQGGNKPVQDVPVWLTIQDDREQVVWRQTEVVATNRFDATRRAPFRFDLPLTKLAPGEYLLTIEAAGEKAKIQRAVRFRVVP